MRNINNIRAFVLAIMATATLGGTAYAQNSATAEAGAEARIVAGISLQKTNDLKFGSIVKTAEGGSVKLDANSGEIAYEGVTRGQNSDYQTASFLTTGEGGYLYSISLPTSATIVRKGGEEKMVIADFEASEGAGQLNDNGQEEFAVGATLKVGPNQATGVYSGSFAVSVQYQ